MRNHNRFFDKTLLYYGGYKGFGAIFGLFFRVFITIPAGIVRLLIRASRH
jgi:hypothetical protein